MKQAGALAEFQSGALDDGQHYSRISKSSSQDAMRGQEYADLHVQIRTQKTTEPKAEGTNPSTPKTYRRTRGQDAFKFKWPFL